jgi:hypothetical protein
MSIRPQTCQIFLRRRKKYHDKIWYFKDRMSSRVSVGLCSKVLLSTLLLVLTVTLLIVREWSGLRWHNAKTRLHQNSSSDCGDETSGQQAEKYAHTIRATAPSGPRPPHYRGFTITFWHKKYGRTSLDERSARRRDLYLTTHSTHKRPTSMSPRWDSNLHSRQTHALHHAVTGIGTIYGVCVRQIRYNILICSSETSV